MPDAARVSAGLEDAVFAQLRRSARALGRNMPSGAGVLLLELAQCLFGRVAASRVQVEQHGGPDDMIAQVEASLGR